MIFYVSAKPKLVNTFVAKEEGIVQLSFALEILV